MSTEAYLQRFDPATDDGPVKPDILSDLAITIKHVLFQAGRDPAAEFDVKSDRLTVDLDGGTAEIHSTHASFPITDGDVLAVQLLYQVAKIGDMVVIIESSECPAILIHSNQRARLPATWIREHCEIPVCHSAHELASALQATISTHAQYAAHLRTKVGRSGESTAEAMKVPADLQAEDRQYLYIQAKAGETALTHLNRAGSYYRRGVKAGSIRPPSEGAMGGTGWRLHLQTGEGFFAIWVSGDEESWLAILREYCRQTGRACGLILHGASFALDDGRNVPLEALTLSKGAE